VSGEKKKMPGGHRIVNCTMCGEMSTSGNLSRHMRRIHHMNVNGTPLSSAMTSLASTRNQSPAPQPRQVPIGVQESLPAVILNNVVRDAVTCMLKRTESINMTSLQQYLITRFPSIPMEMRDPIIIATVTAAQYVALAHMDTKLVECEKVAVWAKCFLAKWAHGMGTSEPAQVYGMTSQETLDPNFDSPMTTFLAENPVVVPLESQRTVEEERNKFNANTEQILSEFHRSQAVLNPTVSSVLNGVVVQLVESTMMSGTEAKVGDRTEDQLQNQMTDELDNSNVGQSIPPMPDLTDFMPVIVNGVVQKPDVEPDDDVVMQENVDEISPATSTDAEITNFTSLLRVETDDPMILEELSKPLITPIVTPVRSQSPVTEEDEKNELQVSNLNMDKPKNDISQSQNVNDVDKLKSVVSKKIKPQKKPKINRPEKENLKSKLKGDAGVQKRKEKVNGSKSKQAEVKRRVNKNEFSSRKRVEELKTRNKCEDFDDDWKLKVPDVKIPHISRGVDRRRREQELRDDDVRFGRSVGLGRGYNWMEYPEHEAYGRPGSPLFARPMRVPGYPHHVQRWMERLPVPWSARR